MTEPAPEPVPVCVRCGAFDVDGPAAAIGVPLCAACFDRPSPDAARRAAPRAVVLRAAMSVLTAGCLSTVGAVLLAGSLLRGPWVLAVFGAGTVATLSAAAAPVWRTLTRRHAPEQLAEALAVDPAALTSPGGGRARIILVERCRASWSLIPAPELAFLVLTSRGAAIYGPTARLAARWPGLDVAAPRVPFDWIRLAEQVSGPFTFLAPATGAGDPTPAHELLAEMRALKEAAVAATEPLS